jgi:hypothetical protein
VSRLRWYGRTVGGTAAVVVGVVAVICALTLAAIGVLALVHGSHHSRQPTVVTVTTSR